MHSIPAAPNGRKRDFRTIEDYSADDNASYVYATELEDENPLTFLVTLISGSGGISEGPVSGIGAAVCLGLALAREHESRFVRIELLSIERCQ